MSHYWAGDNAWTNPPSQALPWRREGSGGGLEYGSGAFDVTKWVAVGGMIVTAHVQLIQPIVAISDSIGHARRLS
jgi:hypothetical protein